MATLKSLITLFELEKIDIRVGRIERVEEVAGSDKLVRLIVNAVPEKEVPDGVRGG